MQRSQDYISQTAPRRLVPAPCRRHQRRREHPCHFSRSIPERGSRARPVSGRRAGRRRFYAAASASSPGRRASAKPGVRARGRRTAPGRGRAGSGGRRGGPGSPTFPDALFSTLPPARRVLPPARDERPAPSCPPSRGREAGPQVAAAGGRPLRARPWFGAGAQDRGPGDSRRLRPERRPRPRCGGTGAWAHQPGPPALLGCPGCGVMSAIQALAGPGGARAAPRGQRGARRRAPGALWGPGRWCCEAVGSLESNIRFMCLCFKGSVTRTS